MAHWWRSVCACCVEVSNLCGHGTMGCRRVGSIGSGVVLCLRMWSLGGQHVWAGFLGPQAFRFKWLSGCVLLVHSDFLYRLL